MHNTIRRSRKTMPSTRVLLDALESRILLNGLTVITHGYEPFSDDRPFWIDAMGSAIAARAGSTTAIYALRLEPTDSSTVHVSQFARLSGPSPTSANSTNGETVLLLDWASVSGVVTQFYSTAYLATVVIPYLEQAFPSIGLDVPLAEGSIQLLGHSRGASLVSELARDLGKSGIWVDQVTTFDPAPVPPDPSVNLGSNVLFADNYYQTSGDGFLVPNGSAVSGAANFGPLSLGGAYSILNGGKHNDVHLFYQGTINTSANASDGSSSVPGAWFPNNGINRTTAGFNFSRLGGGAEPVSGLSTAFGGTAARSAITRTGVQWPNLATVTSSLSTLRPGDTFDVSYRYQDFDSAANVQWFLDSDTNPYNNNSIALASASALASTGATVATGTESFIFNGAAGTYYLEGRITDGTFTRYSYATSKITAVLPLQKLVFSEQPVSGTAGTHLAPIVSIVDDLGNILTDNSSTVTLTLSGAPGGALNGTRTVQAVNGVAVFGDIFITKTGNYSLTATDGTLRPVRSTPIVITPDLASAQLYLEQQPDDLIVGKTLSPPIVLDLQDQYGNLIKNNRSQVTLSIAAGPDNATLTGTSTIALNNGTVTFKNIKLSKAGIYVLQAIDASLPIATPLQFTQAVNPGVTTIPKPATHASYSFGQAISLSSVLKSTASATIPFTGIATLTDAAANILGTATLTAGGAAKFSLPPMPPGIYVCTINYAGDDNHTPATSSTFTLHVNLAGTITKLTAPEHTLFYGEPLLLSALLTSNIASATPHTGTITFKEGATVLGVVALDSDTALWPIVVPTIGNHTYTAVYSGDGNFKTSTAAGLLIRVNKDNAQAVLSTTAMGPIAAGTTFTLTVTVSSLVIGSAIPAGLITFRDGTTILGTALLDSAGTATLTTSLAAIRTHSLTARYAGDVLTNAVTSPALLQVVTRPVV